MLGMRFNAFNTVEAHPRDLLAGRSSARRAQLSTGFARTGGRIAGFGSPSYRLLQVDFSRLTLLVGNSF
jgi:hypothetical protein